MNAFRPVNWTSKEDQDHFLRLLDEYMGDPMGDCPLLDEPARDKLINDLTSLPQSKVFFLSKGEVPVAYLVAFEAYTTFRAGLCFNIHDFYVSKRHRRKGFGREIMERFVGWTLNKGAVKLTLEVREDNVAAQALYKEFGFDQTEPSMLFYSRLNQ